MGFISHIFSFQIVFLVTIARMDSYKTSETNEKMVKTDVFYSPPIYLSPGLVSNKYYYDINFPRGHIALKSFNGEVVDEQGVPVPLYETYLHHWLVDRYFIPVASSSNLSTGIPAGNSGVCDNLSQYYGLGSETRKTSTWVPDPYAIETGNPMQIPKGYEEKWLMNVHAIDTRGVVDKLGCTECRCNLYNVTTGPSRKPLKKDYIGGLLCCGDQKQCQLTQGSTSETRKLYLKYTVKWMDWDDSFVPVKIYIFDVTYSWKKTDGPYIGPSSRCKIEYEVKACNVDGLSRSKCVGSKKAKAIMPIGGKIIYGVGHQHSGAAGISLYGQNGNVLCSSIPHYGRGEKAGNEAGYVVGMSTCYPRPGSTNVSQGEILIVESKYNSSQLHTGVMGLFYILVAE